MIEIPIEQVVDGVGRHFLDFMAEIERLRPKSGYRFVSRVFPPLLASALQSMNLSPEGVGKAYVQVLLCKDQYALDPLLKCLAAKVKADPSMLDLWEQVAHSAHAPPFGRTRKPGSHRGPV